MNIFISLFILGRFACRAFGILFLCSLRTAIFLSPSSPAFSSLPLSISIVSYHVFIHYASPSSLCSSSFSSTLPVPLLPQSLPTLLSSNFHYTTRLNCCSFILCLFYPVSVLYNKNVPSIWYLFVGRAASGCVYSLFRTRCNVPLWLSGIFVDIMTA